MKIIGIGRNYHAHSKELNNPVPTQPVVFLKPDTALLRNNDPFYYPEFTNNIHHEVEIVIRIDREGKHIQEKFAYKYYNEIGLGIDFTARDLQQELTSKGLPWTLAKGFNGSAPVSEFVDKSNFEDLNNLNFSLKINDQLVQAGNTKEMIFSFDYIISFVSTYITLKKGDLIYTGTPAGVGPIVKGDRLEAFIETNKMLDFEIR